MKVWQTFLDEYHRWPLWIPVLIGVGVGIYFSLPREPDVWGILIPVPFLGGLFFKGLSRLPFMALFLICLGFSAGIVRTHTLSTHMLNEEVGPVWLEGQVESVEEKLSPTAKLSNRVILSDLDALYDGRLPERARLTLRGELPKLHPGERIRVMAKLLPLSGPTHPQGFDFRRHNFFRGIEATGFNLGKPRIVKSLTSTSWRMQLERLRQSLTDTLREGMPAPQGGIAAALVTGDRSGIPDQVREMFVASGLAHILAISGLHLSIVAGLIFLLVRRGGALIPPLALRFNTKKIAAIAAIGVTGLYLGISGFGIPAQRAFLMTTLIMTAILINRNALSLRTVAFAATLILLLTPENLLGPSFQLSFAAVVGLIAAYETWQNPIDRWLGHGGVWRWIVTYFGGVAFTSLIATLATLPFTIMTFNQFTLMAVFANMLAVPLTAFWVMPAALITVLLIPFGLESLTLPLLNTSLILLQDIAQWTASLPGALVPVPSPSLPSFLLVVFGALWLCLWTKPWRRWGIGLMSLGTLLLPFTPQPDILIDGQGKLVALRGDEGQVYVTSKRRGKFQREMWLKSLGKSEAVLLPCEFGSCQMKLKNQTILIVNQPYDLDLEGDLIINLTGVPCPGESSCISQEDLHLRGAHGVYLGDTGETRVETPSGMGRF